MFKRILSVFLSVILVLTAICGTVMVGSAETLLSLDFENYPSTGALNKFKIADTGDAAHGKALYGKFTADDANLSPAAAIYTSGSAAKLKSGTEYEISLSYKAVELNSTFALNLYYADNANSYVRKKVPGTTTNTPAAASPYLVRFAHNGTGVTPRNEWLDATVTFTPEYDAYVYIGFWTNAATEIYIDNIIITEAAESEPEIKDPNLIVDWDFESYPSTGALNKFKIADSGDAEQGKALYGNFTADDANLSPAAALMTSASDAKLQKGETYQVKFKYKAINLNSTFAFNLYYTDNANSYVRKKIPDTTTNTAAAVSPYLVRFAHNGTGATPKNEWQEVVASFTSEYDAYVYVGLWTNAVTEFYIDDFTITKVSSVKVNFNTNGGNTVEPLVGASGAALPQLPVPTKENASFIGWYSDEELTNGYIGTVYPDEDITLYAKWGEAGAIYQNFESYVPSGNMLSNGFEIYTKANAADKKVYEGNKSLYRKGENSSYFASLFPNKGQVLEEGKGYEVKMRVYLPEAPTTEGAIRLTFLEDAKNAHSGQNRNQINLKYFANNFDTSGWQEIKLSFISEYDSALGIYSYGGYEAYIDEVILKEVSSVNINFNTNGGNTVEPLVGVSGAALPQLPVPTKENASFIGWYSDEELTNGYIGTVYPDEDITLYAKWGEAEAIYQNFESYVPSGNMLSNGFEIYTKANATDNKVYEGNKSLYRKGENSSYFASLFPNKGQVLEEGKGYEIKMRVYLPEAPTTEGAIRLTFLEDAKNAHSGQNRNQINLKYFANNFDTSGWQEITFNFIAEYNSALGIYSYGGYEIYIDDITLKEVEIATITMDSMGGEKIAPIVGAVGQVVEKVPVPTHKDNLSFAGWYKDSDFSEKFDFYAIPEENITVYAKWLAEGTFEQGFEAYYYEKRPVSTAYNKSGYEIYHKNGEDDPYVHSGNTSIRYKNDPLKSASYAYSVSLFDPTMGKLTIGEKYRVSVYMKFKDIGATFYHALYNNSVVDNPSANYTMKLYSTVHRDILNPEKPIEEYCHGVGDKLQVSGPDEKGWYKFTYEATATENYFSLYLAYVAEVYLDDVLITPLPTGVVSESYSKPYAEPLYDEIFSNYPKAKDKKSNDIQIYKLDLSPRGDYIFSVAINENASGVYAALSFDADGKNIIEGTKITKGSAAKRVILDMSGTVYLIVKNPLGKGAFEHLMLFNTRAAKDELNKNTLPDSSGELPELSELLKGEKYADVLLDSEFINRDDTDANDESEDFGENSSESWGQSENDSSAQGLSDSSASGEAESSVQSDANSSDEASDSLNSEEEEQYYQDDFDNSTDGYSPQTGDESFVIWILMMLFISIGILMAAVPKNGKEG